MGRLIILAELFSNSWPMVDTFVVLICKSFCCCKRRKIDVDVVVVASVADFQIVSEENKM